MKVIVVIRGGVLVEVLSDTPGVKVDLVDFDDLEEGSEVDPDEEYERACEECPYTAW